MLTEDSLVALKSLQNPIWVYDIECFRIRWANDQALIFWEAETEKELYKRDFQKNMSEAIYALLSNNLIEYGRGHEHTQWWTLFPNNKRKEIYCHYSGVKLNDGRIAMLAQVVVTRELLETELSLHLSTTTVSLWDDKGCLKSVNPMFTDLYGESLKHFHELFFSVRQADEIWKETFESGEYEAELFLPTPFGEQWHYLNLRVNQGAHGSVLVVRQFDITERKQRELHHKHLALVDPLTQLKNRYGILQQLEGFAEKGLSFSLFFIDLDNFKTINDYYGHDQGDKLLRALSDRLQFRFSSALSIARLGGDEFLLVEAGDVELELVANKLISAISESFNLEELGDIRVTASIGIASFPADGESVDAILRHADAAMYEAKESGKSTFVYFNQKLSNGIQRRHQMRQLLEKAIAHHEFRVIYQPVINTEMGKVAGIEALLQWDSPELGIIKPSEYMPVAEENGMTGLLECYLLDQSCEQLGSWIEVSDYKNNSLFLVISVSIRQLSCHEFISSVSTLLSDQGIDPTTVMLQVSGAQSLDNKLVTQGLVQLRKLGLKIMLSDFCAQSSSLAFLYRLPITHVKLDKKTVGALEQGALPVIQAIIDMAQKMNIDVVASGVSDQTQSDLLKENGCYLCQGTVFSESDEAKNREISGLRRVQF
ncbi:bifunctional diguanylate cyclase/phosphodiesterase [Neptunomonas sp.]|uniref:sensor domain-containing protein n=1 Tax=Neptunomonas sp. TaxID=1971898 RepID=UPI0025FB1A89|nr:bifunctional diguanylate cyclase/phosphodiesterase [Neptunomonas sp.]